MWLDIDPYTFTGKWQTHQTDNTARLKWLKPFDESYKQQYMTTMNSTTQIIELILAELFANCELPDAYFSELITIMGPTLTTLRLLMSMDSKQRFRMVPEGTVGLPATNLYSLLVKLLGLDEATVVLKWTLSLGERFNQYSFYRDFKNKFQKVDGDFRPFRSSEML